MRADDLKKSDINKYEDLSEIKSKLKKNKPSYVPTYDIHKNKISSKGETLGWLSIILSIFPFVGAVFGIAGVISSNRNRSSDKNRTLSFIGIGLSAFITLSLVIGGSIFLFKDKININKYVNSKSAAKKVVEKYWDGYTGFDTDKMQSCFYKDCNVEITQHITESTHAISYYDPAIELIEDSSEYENKGEWTIYNSTDKEITDYKIFSISAKYGTRGITGIALGQVTVVKINGRYYILEEPQIQEIDEDTYEAAASDEETTEKETSVINMLIGIPETGYCEVPNDFLQFHDYDAMIGSKKYVQYADTMGTNIVTLAVYDKSELNRGVIIENLSNNMKQELDADIKESKTKAGKYDADLLECSNDTFTENCLIFETDDEMIHVLSMKFTEEYENLWMIRDTYTLKLEER